MTLALSLPLCAGDSFLPTLGSTSPALFLDQPGLWAWRGLLRVFGVGKMRPESPLPVQGGLSGGLDPAVRVASSRRVRGRWLLFQDEWKWGDKGVYVFSATPELGVSVCLSCMHDWTFCLCLTLLCCCNLICDCACLSMCHCPHAYVVLCVWLSLHRPVAVCLSACVFPSITFSVCIVCICEPFRV